MEDTANKKTILIAANLTGICAITYFHPYVKQAHSPVTEWLFMASLPIAAAAICFGLYALVFKQRARGGWPLGFLALAWLFAISNIASPYMERKTVATSPTAASAVPSTRSEIDEVLRGAPSYNPSLKPRSEIDEALKDAPARLPGKWTQESTRSAEKGPWLAYAPQGSRFCRAPDGIIITVFPPGLKPGASEADPACLQVSVATVAQL